MIRPPLDIRVTDISVRGAEIYRDGDWLRPDLIAQCQVALVRPHLTLSAPVASEQSEPHTAAD